MAEMVTVFSTEDGTELGCFANDVPDKLDEVEVLFAAFGLTPEPLAAHMRGANIEADRVLAEHPELSFVHIATVGGLVDADDPSNIDKASTGILRRNEDGVIIVKPLSYRGEALPDDLPEVYFD